MKALELAKQSLAALALVPCAALALAGCGGSGGGENGEPTPTETGPKTNADGYVVCDATDRDGLRECATIEPSVGDAITLLTEPLIIEPGTEKLFCSELTVTESDLLIRGTIGRQMVGGHHLAIFLANQPTGASAPYECSDDMVNFRYVTGGGGRPGTDIVIPDGLALKVAAGETIVIQSHYINTSTETWHKMDSIEILPADPATNPTIMDSFIMNNSGFEVPPRQTDMESVQDCTVEAEMSLHLATGHMHEFGTVYDLELIRPGGEVETLYHSDAAYELKDFIGFSQFDPPLVINPGDQLRTRCRWENPTDEPLKFPEEMCSAVMYYSPGQGTLLCLDALPTPIELDLGPGGG